MASFPAGPYTLEFQGAVASLAHLLSFNCDTVGEPEIGTPALEVFLETQDHAGSTLEDGANALWDVIRPLFGPNWLCSTYTLWKRVPENTEKIFISAGTLTNPNGTGAAGTTVLSSQITGTWRSALGNVMKVVLLEPATTRVDSVPIPSSGDVWFIPLSDFILSGANFVMARDRSFPVAPMKVSYGQNEKIFNRRNRS